MKLSDRFKAYVDFEKRTAQQALLDLESLLADLLALEEDYESMRATTDGMVIKIHDLEHRLAECQNKQTG